MTTLVQSFFDRSSSFLQITRPTIKAWMSWNLGKIPSLISELAALERLKKSIDNVVTTLAPSFLMTSSSFLQVTRTTTKSRMDLKFCQIRPWTLELAATEGLE